MDIGSHSHTHVTTPQGTQPATRLACLSRLLRYPPAAHAPYCPLCENLTSSTKLEVYITLSLAEDQATATFNMVQKSLWSLDMWFLRYVSKADRPTDKQTDRHADSNTSRKVDMWKVDILQLYNGSITFFFSVMLRTHSTCRLLFQPVLSWWLINCQDNKKLTT